MLGFIPSRHLKGMSCGVHAISLMEVKGIGLATAKGTVFVLSTCSHEVEWQIVRHCTAFRLPGFAPLA